MPYQNTYIHYVANVICYFVAGNVYDELRETVKMH